MVCPLTSVKRQTTFSVFAPKLQKNYRKTEVMTRREKRRHSFFFRTEIWKDRRRKPYKINIPSVVEVDFEVNIGTLKASVLEKSC